MAQNPEHGAWRPKAPALAEWLALAVASADVTMDAVGIACGLEAGQWRGRHWRIQCFGGGNGQYRLAVTAAPPLVVVAQTDGVPIQTGETHPVWFDDETPADLRLAFLGTVGSFLVLSPASD
jgi:hypothetical protein